MTKTEFNVYRTLANKVVKLLCEEHHSSIKDIEIIYHILRGYPYCLDCDGSYTYNGEYYSGLNKLPIDGLEQIIKMK